MRALQLTLAALLAAAALIATPRPATAQPEEAVDDPLDALDEGLDELLEVASTGDGDTTSRSSWKGFVELRPRVYLRDRNGARNDQQMLVDAELELDLRLAERWTAYLRPRLFVDLTDVDDLQRLEPFEGYVTVAADTWDLRIGQMVENWGIVDTFHPIDILNRRDFATDILDPRRLGELGARYRRLFAGNDRFGEPTLSLYVLPVFRPTRFARGDQRFALGNAELPFVEDGGFEPTGSDEGFYALRFQSTLSTAPFNADLQVVAARGPERLPTLVASGESLVAAYHGNRTVGVGLRAVANEDVLGAFLSTFTFKLEVVAKSPYTFAGSPIAVPDDHVAFVVGFDRAFYHVLRTQDQLTLTVEYAGEEGAQDPSSLLRPFRRDVVARFFWEANDFARTSLELRAIYDLEIYESLFEIAYERQLRGWHEDLQLALQLQIFDPPDTGESFFDFFPDNTALAAALRWDF